MGKDMFAGGRKYTFEMAASLRKQPTHAEQILWDYLKNKTIRNKIQTTTCVWCLGFGFLLSYLQLAIEVDGSIHDREEVRQADERRQKEIEQIGLKFLRFTNQQVEHHLDEVKQTITNFILSNSNKKEQHLPPKSSAFGGDRGTKAAPVPSTIFPVIHYYWQLHSLYTSRR